MVGVGNATEAAMRRRQRRLRAWARHERLSIAMALATVEHHSYGPTANAAPRGQTTGTSAREGEVREQHYGLRAQKRPLPGMRPAPLLEVLPQVGVHWHTVEQRIEHTPFVQILDAPVSQMVEQLGISSRIWTSRCPRRSSKCPRSLKLLPSALCGSRSTVGGTVGGSADHPDSHAHRCADRGADRRHSCFLMVVMVVFQGFTQDRAQQRLRLSRLLTFLLPVEIFKVFAQDRVQQQFQSTTFPLQLHVVEVFVVFFTVFFWFRAPQWIFQFLLGTLMMGFFALFPVLKKVRRYVLTPGRNWPRTRAHPRRALVAL